MFEAVFLVVAICIFAAIELSPVRRSTTWRAMIAPLASIIGSGFMVSAPLLGRELGALAIGGIAFLCAASWLIGGALRYNIANVEALLENGDAPRDILAVERLSSFALFFAYVVSIAYYLALLGAFVMRQVVSAPDPMAAKLIATALLALIGWLGWSGGLRKVISVESLVVSLKLALIGGFLAALALHIGVSLSDGVSIAPPPPRGDWRTAPVLLGLLIMVQGFETSRFLGQEFDRDTRVRTMRLAQTVASLIYVVFFALITPLLGVVIDGHGATAIMDAAAVLAPLLPLSLTVGVVASQFSAAVADAIGGAGIAEGSARRLAQRHAYPVLAFISALVLWETDIYSVISFASRAFAVYYLLQCVVATSATVRAEGWTRAAFGRAGLAAFCALVAVFSTPAE